MNKVMVNMTNWELYIYNEEYMLSGYADKHPILEPKESMVLSLRSGIGVPAPMTLEEIANLPEFGVTRERIRQIENKALNKIRRSPKMMNLLRDYAA